MKCEERKATTYGSRRLMMRNIVAGGAIAAAAMASLSEKAGAQVLQGLDNSRGPGPGPTPGPSPGPRPGPSPSCFLAGTRVLTPDGEIAIETLSEGDLVVTRSGLAKPIVRVHKSSFQRLRGGDWPKDVLPVRIEAGALGAGTPHTDIYLSMTHCLLIDGVLIPAGDLVNGTTISIVDGAMLDRIDYFHIELAEHDVITAEGMLCESKLNMDASMPSSTPCEPIVRLAGAAGALGSRFRSAMSPIIDRRTRFDVIRDRLEDRAEAMRAA